MRALNLQPAPTASSLAAPPAAAPAARSWRRTLGRVALGTLQGLLALFFIYAGVNKWLGLQQEQEITTNFARFGLGPGFRYFVATLELVGGLGLLVPRWAGAAALWLMGVMAGAIISHLTVLPPAYFAIGPLVIMGLLGLIVRARWVPTRALLAGWRRR